MLFWHTKITVKWLSNKNVLLSHTNASEHIILLFFFKKKNWWENTGDLFYPFLVTPQKKERVTTKVLNNTVQFNLLSFLFLTLLNPKFQGVVWENRATIIYEKQQLFHLCLFAKCLVTQIILKGWQEVPGEKKNPEFMIEWSNITQC